MANDIFGDESLFSEFDRDRETQNIFIHFDQDASGAENRSRIVFRSAESDAEESDDEDENETEAAMQTTEDPEATRKSNGEDQALASGEADVVGPEVKEEAAETETNGEGQGGAPQTTSYQEQFEKNKYRRFARLIDSTRCVSDEQSPGVQILFQNNKFARKYRSRIEQFIISLTQHADRKDFSKTATDLSGRAAVPTCVDINDSLPTEKRNNRMWQAHGIIGCAQFHYGFMVDSRGWPHDADEPAEYTNGELPKYFQVFDQVFPVDKSEAVPDKPAKPKDSCFNCGGDHRLTECKTPKDHGRIRAKRQEHRDRSSNRPSNAGRYHKDPELDPLRARFQAGVISDCLREAIGLKPNQLPSYIYRMRLFGYPPGWLMEANRKTSTLAMYDKDGNETNLRGESLEDGEYGEQSPTEPSEMFDLNKIIEYPGFTVPVPLGFIDESDSIGMPPIQQHQLKKTLMEDMVAKETARKRRLEEEDEAEKSKKRKTGEDMEIVEDEEGTAAPVETSTPAESEKTGKVEEEAEGEAKDRDDAASPTMDTLQQEYKILVQQLDSEGETALANGSSADTAGATPSNTPKEKSLCESELIRQKNFSFTSSTSISKDYGTPILVRDKSFQALPSPEKFGQGIEDHIPFENLPDSVGTFDRMKNLFTIIRNKVKKFKK